MCVNNNNTFCEMPKIFQLLRRSFFLLQLVLCLKRALTSSRSFNATFCKSRLLCDRWCRHVAPVALVMSPWWCHSVSDDDYKFETEFVGVESDRRELTRTSSLLRATLAASTSAKLLPTFALWVTCGIKTVDYYFKVISEVLFCRGANIKDFNFTVFLQINSQLA